MLIHKMPLCVCLPPVGIFFFVAFFFGEVHETGPARVKGYVIRGHRAILYYIMYNGLVDGSGKINLVDKFMIRQFVAIIYTRQFITHNRSFSDH